MIEIGLGMGVDAAPGAARLVGNSLDNLLNNIDNLRSPSAGSELVPVDGVLPKLGRDLLGDFGRHAPGLGTQGTAGSALSELFPPFLQSNVSLEGITPESVLQGMSKNNLKHSKKHLSEF